MKCLDVINASRDLVIQIIKEMAKDNLHSFDKYLLMPSMSKALF